MLTRVTNINQLKQGDKIAHIRVGYVDILEFREIHPHKPQYSIMLDEWSNSTKWFLNEDLEHAEFYVFQDTGDDWKEIHNKMVERATEESEKPERKLQLNKY